MRDLPTTLPQRAAAVRRFNRLYTRRIGLLREHLHDSAFSLTEARILYELASRPGLTMSELCRELNLNAGYLSRVMSGFEKQGLLAKTRSEKDARAAEMRLTAQGQTTFETLDKASQAEVECLLQRLSAAEQQQLVEAMAQIESLLTGPSPAYLLREPRPGDMGWVVHRHGALYAQEYGWNEEFEALVADIVSKYVRDYDRQSDHCWIAEQDGRVVGSVFVVRHDATTAKLRLLYVEPAARGLGIGRRLVDECLRFARRAGYTRMILWTNSVLTGARRIYEQAGFRLTGQEAHRSFGKDLVGETWELEL